MAVFGGLILTNDGRNLLAKAQTGKLLNFKRVILGDGQLGNSESIINISKLKNEVLSCKILDIKIMKSKITTITFALNNQNLTEGFCWRELGIIAEDPDTKEELLYCYGNARENGEYISASSETDVLEKKVNVDLIIDNVENISAIIDESLVFIDKKELEKLANNLKQEINNLKENSYFLKVTQEIEANTEFEIPCNYKVGANVLDVYLNTEKLILSSDDEGTDGHYLEVGETDSISNKIKTTSDWNLEAGDVLEFIVRGDYSDTE